MYRLFEWFSTAAYKWDAAVKFQQDTVGLLNMLDTGWEDKYVLHTED